MGGSTNEVFGFMLFLRGNVRVVDNTSFHWVGKGTYLIEFKELLNRV